MKTSENLLGMSQSDKCIQLGWTVNYSTFIIQHNKEYNNYTVQLGLFIICSKKKKPQNKNTLSKKKMLSVVFSEKASVFIFFLLLKS